MNLDLWLLVGGLLALATMLASGLERHLPLTAPLVALLTGATLGPHAFGLLDVHSGTSVLHSGAEVLLAVSLVAVALRYPIADLRDAVAPAALLASVGMVLSAAITALLAWRVLGLEPAHALVLGAALSPTDPVLASSVVTGDPATRALPGRLRRTLSLESGANDGLGWPMVVVAIAIAVDHHAVSTALEVTLGVAGAIVGGVAIGWLAGHLMRRLAQVHELEQSALFVAMLALAVTVLGGINLVGGDGVLGVFAAGLAYNRSAGDAIVSEEREVEEGVNRMLVLPLFVLLGVMLPWDLWAEHLGPVLGFVLAVLVLRRLPVVFALRRWLRLDTTDATFLGWFGPMGVASAFYVSMALHEGVHDSLLWAAGTAVIAASTLVHGVTATPARALYERRHPALVLGPPGRTP